MDISQMNLTALNKKELVDKCKELGIKKYSGKNKDQLIELITSGTKVMSLKSNFLFIVLLCLLSKYK
jgi:hypothetical protein